MQIHLHTIYSINITVYKQSSAYTHMNHMMTYAGALWVSWPVFYYIYISTYIVFLLDFSWHLSLSLSIIPGPAGVFIWHLALFRNWETWSSAGTAKSQQTADIYKLLLEVPHSVWTSSLKWWNQGKCSKPPQDCSLLLQHQGVSTCVKTNNTCHVSLRTSSYHCRK